MVEVDWTAEVSDEPVDDVYEPSSEVADDDGEEDFLEDVFLITGRGD